MWWTLGSYQSVSPEDIRSSLNFVENKLNKKGFADSARSQQKYGIWTTGWNRVEYKICW